MTQLSFAFILFFLASANAARPMTLSCQESSKPTVVTLHFERSQLVGLDFSKTNKQLKPYLQNSETRFYGVLNLSPKMAGIRQHIQIRQKNEITDVLFKLQINGLKSHLDINLLPPHGGLAFSNCQGLSQTNSILNGTAIVDSY